MHFLYQAHEKSSHQVKKKKIDQKKKKIKVHLCRNITSQQCKLSLSMQTMNH